ncbi:hypothetical protein [Falsiroseomonas tokyonensis]|uniref:Uncharacterized protein n=1 Tax=Falsiroseomonas tokyonensis TaxID=430521 RepID=A0ABV7BZG9_9PROT|nr:hypothetical protein [Falsiroseomonas tokyonensis]MBU8540799.1 hypothetical protein [Falsiroseomonas tokyonensis]
MTSDERIALAEEAESLPIHVRMCALRHRQILSQMASLESAANVRMSRIEKLLWGILGVITTGLAGGASQIIPLLQAVAGSN